MKGKLKYTGNKYSYSVGVSIRENRYAWKVAEMEKICKWQRLVVAVILMRLNNVDEAWRIAGNWGHIVKASS